MRQIILTAVLVLGFGIGLASSAEIKGDHLAFAVESETGTLDSSACQSHGGRLVNDNHRNVVIKMGRLDTKLNNVIYYDNHPYVTYRMAISSLFGTSFATGLCHF